MFSHRQLKQRIHQPPRQPRFHTRQWQGLKPRGVYCCKLPHKRKDAYIRSARRDASQLTVVLELLLQHFKQQLDGLRFVVLCALGIAVTLRVFVTVQVVFEFAFADRQQ